MSDRADKLQMVSKLGTTGMKFYYLFCAIKTNDHKYKRTQINKFLFCLAEKSASALKIQAAFRSHQARLRLKKQAAWQIHEKLEYASEQTEAKVRQKKFVFFIKFIFQILLA